MLFRLTSRFKRLVWETRVLSVSYSHRNEFFRQGLWDKFSNISERGFLLSFLTAWLHISLHRFCIKGIYQLVHYCHCSTAALPYFWNSVCLLWHISYPCPRTPHIYTLIAKIFASPSSPLETDGCLLFTTHLQVEFQFIKAVNYHSIHFLEGIMMTSASVHLLFSTK
jgi:hypothetical protein